MPSFSICEQQCRRSVNLQLAILKSKLEKIETLNNSITNSENLYDLVARTFSTLIDELYTNLDDDFLSTLDEMDAVTVTYKALLEQQNEKTQKIDEVYTKETDVEYPRLLKALLNTFNMCSKCD